MKNLENRCLIDLQKREQVLPPRDNAATDWIRAGERQAHLPTRQSAGWHNRLIYCENLLAMAALPAGNGTTPRPRGQISIDPPFDSKVNYRTEIVLPGAELEQKPMVIEQCIRSDTWAEDAVSYEFGVKASIAITPWSLLIVGVPTFPGNPYDCHTQAEQLEQTAILPENIGVKPQQLVVDLEFRGVEQANAAAEIIHRGKRRSLSHMRRCWSRRRQVVEPIHPQADHRMKHAVLAARKTGEFCMRCCMRRNSACVG